MKKIYYCLPYCMVAFMVGVIVNLIPYEVAETKLGETLIMAGATVFAAFVGAVLAFRYQLIIKKQEKEDEDFVRGNLALTKLLIMRKKLQQFSNDFIDPHKGGKLYFVKIPSVPEENHKNISVDTSGLTFLYNTEDLGLVGDIDIAWIHYESTISSIKLRSSYYHDAIMPILHQDPKNILVTLNNDIEILKNIIGSIPCQKLEIYTKTMIDKINYTVELLDRVRNRLEKQMEIRFRPRIVATEANMVPVDVASEE